LDARVSCRVRYATRARTDLHAAIGLRYSASARTVAVTAFNPVADALLLLPRGCRSRPDGLDRIYDSYFEPGFSFASGFGADRWLQSAAVAIPAAMFHRSEEIAIPLGSTRAGTPPRGCAVQHPSYERCRTGGRWAGVLLFRRRAG
jgi:hypothetical protein